MLRHIDRKLELAIEFSPNMQRNNMDAYRVMAFYHSGSDVTIVDGELGGKAYGGKTLTTVRSLHKGLKNFETRDIFKSFFKGDEHEGARNYIEERTRDKSFVSKISTEFDRDRTLGERIYKYRVAIFIPNDNSIMEEVLRDVIKKGFKVSAADNGLLESHLLDKIQKDNDILR